MTPASSSRSVRPQDSQVSSLANIDVKPAVLSNLYPRFDSAGNKLQEITIRFGCLHVETYYSLDLGKGWKPRSKRQIERDELFITCPAGTRVCKECSR